MTKRSLRFLPLVFFLFLSPPAFSDGKGGATSGGAPRSSNPDATLAKMIRLFGKLEPLSTAIPPPARDGVVVHSTVETRALAERFRKEMSLAPVGPLTPGMISPPRGRESEARAEPETRKSSHVE